MVKPLEPISVQGDKVKNNLVYKIFVGWLVLTGLAAAAALANGIVMLCQLAGL